MDVRLEFTTDVAPRFSADGQHFALDSSGAEGHVLVLDGREVARSVRHFMHFELAPDGAWISYATAELRAGQTRSVLVHRGVTSELPGEPVALAVTPDGEHVAVGVSRDGGDDGAVLLDGKQLARAVSPRMLTLSHDGKRWAYAETISHRTGGETVTVDGVRSKPMLAAWGLKFSPDGAHVAYQSLQQKGRSTTARIVVDGKPGKTWLRTSEVLRFTDAGAVVYEAADAAGAWVVVGEQAYGPYRRVYGPDVAGARVAWGAETVDGRMTVLRVFLDGTPIWRGELGELSPMGDRGPAVQGLVVAPDGPRVAFGTGVVHASREPAATQIDRGEPVSFDAAGERLALVHRSGAGQTLEVVDARAGTVFTPEGPPMVEVLRDTIRFTGDDVHYFARTATQLVFVRAPARVVMMRVGP
jgi:hypothetical protein